MILTNMVRSIRIRTSNTKNFTQTTCISEKSSPLSKGRKPNSPIVSHQHHVEQNVAGSLQRDRVPQGRKVEPHTWDSTNSVFSLSLLSETKSTKVYSCSRSLPIARRGNNDGRHMGDSPGARQEPRTFLSFLFSLFPPSLSPFGCPLCGPDFMDQVLCMCAQKSATATASSPQAERFCKNVAATRDRTRDSSINSTQQSSTASSHEEISLSHLAACLLFRA